MSYLEYFGFDSEPFGHAPSSRFYYASAEHTQALRRLLHCVQSMQGLAVLVGDIGRGKTTLARRLLEALPEAEYAAALIVIVHKDVAPLWLIRHIAQQLGVDEPADSAPELIGQLYNQLNALHLSGRRAVVLIDEAQMLETRALMEEFRGLLNLEVPGHKLITFVFFGLPSIEDTLRLDPPLAQRVAMRYALKPLGAPACTAYITHRLEVVGARQQLLSEGALEAIYAYTQGVPRVINTLCDNLLLEMFIAGAHLAEREHAVAVAENLKLVAHVPAAPQPTAPQASAAMAAAVEPTSPTGAPQVIALQVPDFDVTPDIGANTSAQIVAEQSAPLEGHKADDSELSVPAWSMPEEAAAHDLPVEKHHEPTQPPVESTPPSGAEAAASGLPEPRAEDWSGLSAVGSFLTNATNEPAVLAESSDHLALTPKAPPDLSQQRIGQAAPDDLSPEDHATQNALASTSYGVLDLDEVTALLAQIRLS